VNRKVRAISSAIAFADYNVFTGGIGAVRMPLLIPGLLH
jgi:hypothetical protein